MSKHFPKMLAKATHKQVDQFRSSNGAKGNEMFGKPVFLLETVGRKSGEPRQNDDLIVVGSNGGNPVTPNWYKNLIAAEKTEVQVGPDRWWTTAREVQGAEFDECWALAAKAYPDFNTYQELTDRRIPVAVLARVASD